MPVPRSFPVILAAAVLLSTVSTAEGQTGPTTLLGYKQPVGPIELQLRSTRAITEAVTVDLNAVRYDPRSQEQPGILLPLAGGLAGKVLINGLSLLFAGDYWHAFPPIIMLDPVVTAFGVYVGNEYRGSFVLDALASYGSFYLSYYLATDIFLAEGAFDEPESYNDLYMSMGVQLVTTVLVERLFTALKTRKPGR